MMGAFVFFISFVYRSWTTHFVRFFSIAETQLISFVLKIFVDANDLKSFVLVFCSFLKTIDFSFLLKTIQAVFHRSLFRNDIIVQGKFRSFKISFVYTNYANLYIWPVLTVLSYKIWGFNSILFGLPLS